MGTIYTCPKCGCSFQNPGTCPDCKEDLEAEMVPDYLEGIAINNETNNYDDESQVEDDEEE